jgi:type I restriction enzyme S subunit
LPLPTFSEQEEIVRILEKLLDHEDEARVLIDMEEQIDLLEKSILSKAFSGELGTNDTNDEPAIELLKRSLKEKATPAEKQDK